MKVAVIGGGISGIITSIGLSENGHEVHLFEKSSSLGGRIKSEEKQGTVYDIGFHVLHTGYSSVKRWIDTDAISHHKMHPSSILFTPSKQKVKLIGDVFSAPSTLIGSATSMSPFNALRLLKWRVKNKKSDDVRDINSRKPIDIGFTENGFSESFQKEFLKPLFAGITLSDERQESIEFADFIWGVMSKAPIILPKNGMKSIIEHLEKRMKNVVINLDSEIQEVTRNEITIKDQIENFDKVVLATQQNSTAKILELNLEGEERTTRTYIYKTKQNPIKKLQIMLNSEYNSVTSPFVHVHSPTALNNTNNHLVVATLIGKSSLEENWDLADKNMSEWFPNDFTEFERFSSTFIANALPNSSIEGSPRIPHEINGLLIAGDHTNHPSLHGAILSAERVIQSVGGV